MGSKILEIFNLGKGNPIWLVDEEPIFGMGWFNHHLVFSQPRRSGEVQDEAKDPQGRIGNYL